MFTSFEWRQGRDLPTQLCGSIKHNIPSTDLDDLHAPVKVIIAMMWQC